MQDMPPVLGEHNKLEQVFINIISNARDSLDEFEAVVKDYQNNGNIPQWLEAWSKKIVLSTYQEGDFILITITDTGAGIPKNIIDKIFEPFFTTKEVGKGTGLGLSITYGIVSEFGGTIEVETEEMKGCKFILRFPVFKK